MFTKLKEKFTSDRGDSTLVSTILVIPLILGILITMIDVSVYFANRGQVLNMVRDGARQVAIFGGDGTATTATPLEKAYGQSRTTVCAGLSANPVISAAVKATTTATECSVLRNVGTTQGLISLRVTDIQCGVANSAGAFTGTQTTNIGQQVGCQLTWRYDSIPGSGLGFMERAKTMGYGSAKSLKDMGHITKVNTTSEVNMSGIPLQNW
jgi:Flp pilus assembly protein TadG